MSTDCGSLPLWRKTLSSKVFKNVQNAILIIIVLETRTAVCLDLNCTGDPAPLWKQTFFDVNWPITKKSEKGRMVVH